VELKQQYDVLRETAENKFESNQSGIETHFMLEVVGTSAKFESNQSGIETEPVSLYRHSVPCLNRTRVELKLFVATRAWAAEIGLNRTRVELKR